MTRQASSEEPNYYYLLIVNERDLLRVRRGRRIDPGDVALGDDAGGAPARRCPEATRRDIQNNR